MLGCCVFALTSLLGQAQCDTYVPGPNSATLLGNVMLDGVPANALDELAAYDLQGVCLGKANVVESDGLAFFSLVVYGDDATTPEDEGLVDGDAFVLELHDVSTGDVILFSQGATFDGWTNTNGAPLSGWTEMTSVPKSEISPRMNPATIPTVSGAPPPPRQAGDGHGVDVGT